jgi:hypothetical protein
MGRLKHWLRRKITDHTVGVARVFIVCGAGKHIGCGRVVPYYRLYGKGITSVGCPKCGQIHFRPATIPEWRAALWLFWGWVTRQGDPRMPMRIMTDTYA